jgi:hypothetical protein
MVTRVSGKVCAGCREYKPREAFRPMRSAISGLSSRCRACMSEDLKAWRAAHPDYVSAYNLARRIEPAELRCSECGGTFHGRKDRRTCSDDCRRERKRRMDTRWPK